MNLKIKIHAKRFANVFIREFQGQQSTKRCLCIPIDDNFIFESQKTGEVYINLIAVERKQVSQYGDTHFIRINYPKEMTDALTKEQRDALPIIGDVTPLQPKSQPIQQLPPTTYPVPTPGDAIPVGDNQSGTGLPF